MPGFFNTVLDFSKYIHAPDKFFPHGKLYLQEDMYARFNGVETQFVIDGGPEGAKTTELSFYDRDEATLKQFAVLRTYCEMAKESAIAFLRDMDEEGMDIPTDPLKRQIAEAELGITVLSRAIRTKFINDWA